jgi:hypothetical protein
VTVGKLSVDIHVARACICVYVHADLRYASALFHVALTYLKKTHHVDADFDDAAISAIM